MKYGWDNGSRRKYVYKKINSFTYNAAWLNDFVYETVDRPADVPNVLLEFIMPENHKN
jgi:hypothetical protein